MEQLGFEGMPRRLFSASASKLTTFSDCPRRYRMAYVDRPTPPKGRPWGHTSLGVSIHNALRAWWDLPIERRTPEAARVLLRAAWVSDGFIDKAQQAAVGERAIGWLERYLDTLDPTKEPIGLERTVATKTSTIVFSGRIDRLDDRDGEPVVVDYKTGRAELSTDDVRGSLALAMYALATGRTLRQPCYRVELHHIPAGTEYTWVHTEQSLARHLRRAEETAADIVAAEDALHDGADPDEVFPAVPRPGCSWCDFRRSCPEGRAASEEKAPWAALEMRLSNTA